MAFGDVILITVGYTAGDSGSNRKLYPIKRKYKQIQATQTPVFPDSYALYSSQEYWFPYSGVTPSDSDYIPYIDAAEYGWNDDQNLRPPSLVFPNPNLRKYSDYDSGTRIVYANEIYVSTVYFFTWASTKFAQDKNPYTSNRIKKWKKLSDTSEVWTQYWYHPLLRRFYLLENIDEIQELPDFDEPDQTRWDSFIGDAAGLNLENFTFAQIQELVSTGTPIRTAEALINSNDARIINSIVPELSTNIQPSTSTGTDPSTVTLTVTRQNSAAGQSGESPNSNSNLPTMIQRTATGERGLKNIVDEYVFNLRPNNISYSEIGAVWSEIERVNNYSLLDYRNPKLMKISFEFVVEAYSGSVSSAYESCEAKLRQLRRMAGRAERVEFRNFDSLFGEKALSNQINAQEFAIVDMSINSVQRTRNDENNLTGEINRATVSMTVQEVYIDSDNFIFFPKLRTGNPGGGGGGGGGGDPELCTRTLSKEVPEFLVTVPKYGNCPPTAT